MNTYKAKLRHVLLIFLAFIMLATFSCGRTETKKPITTTDDSFNDINNGELVVGADINNEPFVFKDSFTEEIVGLNVDIIKEVCSKLNLNLKIVPLLPENIQTALQEKTVNMILNPIEINEDNFEVYEFSKPYINNQLMIFSRLLSPVLKTSQLKDKIVGVKKISQAETYLDLNANIKNNLKRVISYESNDLMFNSLISNSNVDTIITNKILGTYFYIKNNEQSFIKKTLLKSFNSFLCFYFDKTTVNLRNSIDTCLDELQSEKKLKEISIKWLKDDYITREFNHLSLDDIKNLYKSRYIS